MLKLKNISIAFDNQPVLKNLSCTIEPGDFIVIVGANGAGKSTLFDIISGSQKPDSGSVLLDNQNITTKNEIERSAFVGRLFQNPQRNCVGTMTVKENLSMALYKNRSCKFVRGTKTLEEALNNESIQSLISTLKPLLSTPMNKLSGGQRQLISFIMQTVIPPKLLLLDEPTAALDPESATTLLLTATQFIKKHGTSLRCFSQLPFSLSASSDKSSGFVTSTLLITHDPHIALSLGNKIWVLQDGIIAKQFNQEDKEKLSPDDLIGHIDYEKLKELG